MVSPVDISTTILLFATLVMSDTAQDHWISPPAPDYNATLTVGEFYAIQWDSKLKDYFQSSAPSADVSSVDLWITDSNLYLYGEQLATEVNLNVQSGATWQVNVQAEWLQLTNEWMFRWLPQGFDYWTTFEGVSSPRFHVRNAAEKESSIRGATSATRSTTAAATSSQNSTTLASQNPSAAPSTTATPKGNETAVSFAVSSPSCSCLSSGVKAGIAIAVIHGTAVVFGLGWFSSRRFDARSRKRPEPIPPTSSNAGEQVGAKTAHLQPQNFEAAKTSEPGCSELGSTEPSSATPATLRTYFSIQAE